MSSSRKSNEGLTSLSNTPCSFTLSENPETASEDTPVPGYQESFDIYKKEKQKQE